MPLEELIPIIIMIQIIHGLVNNLDDGERFILSLQGQIYNDDEVSVAFNISKTQT